MKYLSIQLLLALFIFTILEVKAQAAFSSANSGDWNNPSTWTLTGGTSATNYPVAGDDVTIQGGHTVEVNVISQAQSVNVTGATLSFNTSTVNSVLLLSDQLTISNASSIVMNMGTLTILGNVTVSAASSITQNGGAITVSGFIFVNAPTAITSPTTGTSLINVDLGIFSCVGGLTLTSATNATRIAELRVGLSAVNIVGALTTTTANSKITFSNVGVLTLAGVVTIPNASSFSAGNGKVLYVGIPGVDQTVAPLTYNRLSISGLGAGLKKITNTVTVTDTLALLTDTLTVTGLGVLNINNGATIVRTEGFLKDLPTFLGTVNLLYNGATNVTTGKEMPTNTTVLQNLVINNVSGVRLGADITVNTNITLQNGLLNTNSFTLNITNPAGGVGNDPAVSFTNGYVQGKINRSIDTSTGMRVFPFGISLVNGSRVLRLDYTSAPTVGGTLEVQHFEERAPSESGFPLTDGTITLVSSLPFYWRADATGLSGGNYILSLTAQGMIGIADYTALRVIKRPTSGGAWTLDGLAATNMGSNSEPTVIRNDMSGFSEFGIANKSTMFRTIGNVNFTSAANWETSEDGILWIAATSAPSAVSDNIIIYHQATLQFNATLDQVTVENGGILVVNTLVTLTLQDGTGTDLIIQNGGTLEIESFGVVEGLGSFTLNTGGTLKNSNTLGLQAINLSGTKTFNVGANYELDGLALQTLNSPIGFSANNLVINNIFGVKLNNPITVTGNLTVSLGTLDLNANLVDLGATGVLVENRVLNYLVVDNSTGLNETNKGGYIQVTNRPTTSTLTQIAGLGIHLADAGTVSINRYHYKATGMIGEGILKNYEVTGTPTNATMRIEFAPDELDNITPDNMLKLFRYNGTSWENQGGNWTNAMVDYVELTNITTFSPWTVGTEATPLPITLVHFEGKRTEGTNFVLLTWTTATEINNKGFEIEQSEDGTDFHQIGFVDGRGNSSTLNNYHFSFNNPNALYVRLKQMDLDGKFSYSPIRFVEGTASKLYFAPNPINNEVHLQGNIKADDVLNLEVVGTVGRILWRGKGKAIEVENDLNIALRNLKAGLYLFRLQANGKMTVQKMVKQ